MRPHLATLVDDFYRHGKSTAIVTYRGNRRTASTYRELAELAERFAAELMRREIGIGERVVLWGQNGIEWVGAFFGCVMRGVIAVPLDAAGGLDFATRVIADTSPRLVVGDAQLLGQLAPETASIVFEEFGSALSTSRAPVEPSLGPDTTLQILFTSGTTAEPKGIVHTHRNVLASLAPMEREMRKYLKYERWFHPLRILHTLPLSHVFGQFMGLWIPPLLAMEVHFESRLQPQRLIEITHRERISVLAAVPRVLELLRDSLMAQYPRTESGDGRGKRRKRLEALVAVSAHSSHLRLQILGVCVRRGFAGTRPGDLLEYSRFCRDSGLWNDGDSGTDNVESPVQGGQGHNRKSACRGVKSRLREDGEILVRGDMVSTATWRNGAMEQSKSPWLATGDLRNARRRRATSLSGTQEPGDRHLVWVEYSSGRCGGGVECTDRRGGFCRGSAVDRRRDGSGRRTAVSRIAGGSATGSDCGKSAAGGVSADSAVEALAGAGFSADIDGENSTAAR